LKNINSNNNFIGGLVRPASTKSGFEICIEPKSALSSTSLKGWLDFEEYTQRK